MPNQNSNSNTSPKPNTEFLSCIADEYVVPKGMPLSVWQNKYSRVKGFIKNEEFDNDTPESNSNQREIPEYQTWGERIKDVVIGNFTLDPRLSEYGPELVGKVLDNPKDYEPKYFTTKRAIEELVETHRLSKQGVMAYAGRHLQHGDPSQYKKIGELFTNCSTSMFSWSLFFLLLKGSGVGRDYSSATCLVDWNYMPETRFVLEGPDQWGNGGHPDYEPWIESLQSAQHKYDSESERVRWFTVEDSAEGWVKVVTILETAAFHKNNKDHLFIFDMSKIRAKGAPISGQQDRPASGPVPFLQAMKNVASIKGAGMKPWKQALFCDHYLASCVALGGIRRAARISTKYWKDRDIIEFADIKREGFLQSANNSILVDAEFWKYVEDTNNRSPWAVHARRLFSAATEAAYMDGTGEPGFINVDKLTSNSANLDKITPDTFINPEYHERLGGIHRQTKSMVKYMLERVKSNKYLYIVNPCVTADTWVATDNGMQQVSSLIKDDGWVEGDELSVTYIVNDEKVKGSPFFATGYKKVYQLTTKEGYTVKLTDNHQVRVEVGRKQKFGGGYTIDYQWVEAKDLEPGDKIVLHNHGLDQKTLQQDSEIEGYTLGLLVGDGCFIATAGGSDSARITLWDNKKDVLPKIKSYTDDLNLTWHECNGGRTLTTTSVGLAEVAKFWGLTNSSKTLTDEIMGAPRSFLRGFVAGIFDTDGSVQGTVDKGVSLRISSIDKNLIDRLQIVLLRFGMKTTQRKVRDAGVNLLPDSNRNPKEYHVAALYELMLGKDNVTKFFQTFDICNPTHTTKIETINAQYGTRGAYSDRFTAEFVSLDYVGRETVYDVCVPGPHAFSANGFYAHNCSEIPLAIYGGYCIVGDVCLTYARTLEEARKAFGLMAKFLMRVNLMPMLYQSEVKRTNRIGVGFIGVFEFAWNHFGLNFHDVISVMEGSTKKVSSTRLERALQFAEFIESCHQEVENSCKEYAIEMGVEVPHTQNCLKPAGTVAKVMNSTEAANLPANNFYLRNNQYLLDDPQYHDLVKRGYPARDISHAYPGHHIVGFPTKQKISDIMGDQCVVVGDTTPKEQYLWLRWLERFWITKGVENTGGQIAYTMKYFPDQVSLAEFQKILMEDQSAVKCCSWMQIMDMSKFAYQPEEPITKEQYDQLMAKIDLKSAEDYDEEQLACAGGICPMESNQLVFVDGTQVK